MQVFREIKTDKLAWSTMKAMMRYSEMSKVLKTTCWEKKCIAVKGKVGERGLFIIKGFWVWTNTDGFFWRTDLFSAGLAWCNCSLGTSKKNKGLMSKVTVVSGSARIECRSPLSPITEPMTLRGRNSTFVLCTISPSKKWLWELFPFKQSQAPNRILKQNDQGRNLQVLHNTVFCTTTYKTLKHWAKCLSFYWKHTINTDNGQLNKEEKVTSIYDIQLHYV